MLLIYAPVVYTAVAAVLPYTIFQNKFTSILDDILLFWCVNFHWKMLLSEPVVFIFLINAGCKHFLVFQAMRVVGRMTEGLFTRKDLDW